jgi:hypothetical protein
MSVTFDCCLLFGRHDSSNVITVKYGEVEGLIRLIVS